MKIALVCTRGGHLTETLELVEALKGFEFFFVIPHSPRDVEVQGMAPVYFYRTIDAHLLPFIEVFFWSLKILLHEKPDIIISLGPEIAIPFFFWGKLLGMRTLYIESWCRVDNLSLTGRILYFWADEFWVQWPELQKRYRRARYRGSIYDFHHRRHT